MTLDVNASAERKICVPERVCQRANQSGLEARQWLKNLPQRIGDIERDWQVRIGQALPGGSAAFVAPAKMVDGGEAVVKLNMPDDDFKQEIEALVRAEGNGYANVLRHDRSRNALLLEFLGAPMHHVIASPEQMMAQLCQTLTQAWRLPPAPDQAIEHKAQGLSQLISELWERLDHPCSKAIVNKALEYAARRVAAFDAARCVVVHGDPHPGNALKVTTPRHGAASGFVFVDPDGFLCEPEYDLGVVLRDWSPQLLRSENPARLARRYCRLLAQESQLQEDAIWEWGFIERVSTGLYVSAYGSAPLGQPFFDTATLLVNA